MSSAEIVSPAGTPSMITVSAGPCDSPAVRKRSIESSFYRTFCNTPARARERVPVPGWACFLHFSFGVKRALVADRYLVLDDHWLDIATGRRVAGRVFPRAIGETRAAACVEDHAIWRDGARRLIDYGEASAETW